MEKRNAIWAAAAIAVVAILFILMQPPKPTGLFIGLFAGCNNNGVCDAADPYDPYNPYSVGETYLTCPEDCCESDCTANDGVCHSACTIIYGCALKDGCDGKSAGYKFCSADLTSLITCCGSKAICASGAYCTGSACGSCSTACDNLCQSKNCFGTDPDCDAAGGVTGICCGNSKIEGSEQCDKTNIGTATCVSRGYTGGTLGCTPQCTFDANLCTSSCPIACNDNAACNTDNNALTVDVCVRPGACDANCSRSCTARCADDSGCNDNNSLTTDTCNNAGTCSASCAHAPCIVACSFDSQCNDNRIATTDRCRNPGRCDAWCRNDLCNVLCDSNSDCDDRSSLTVDACVNPGLCNASCIHTPCAVACTSDSGCNDNVASTIDKCNNPGACNASCSHSAQSLSIVFQVGFESAVVRGQTVDLTLMVKDETGNPITGAVVSLTDPKGNTIAFTSTGNGYYAGQYNVPSDLSLGTQSFSFSAASGGKTAYKELALQVNKANIGIVLIQPAELVAAPGQEIEFKFKAVYDNNAIVQGAVVSAVLNGTAIPLQSDSGVFTGKYIFAEKDVGQAALVINAVDSVGNSGAASFTFDVVQPLPLILLALLLLLIIAVAVALYMLKKKQGEKKQHKWVFEKEQ